MSQTILAPCKGLALALLFLSVPMAGAATFEPYSEAEKPPAGMFQNLRGEQQSVLAYKGSVVLVNFWASWCTPCITEIPSLRGLQDTLAGQPFRILAVNVEEGPFKVDKFTRLVDMPFPILLDQDGSAFDAWGGVVLPTSFLIDPEGRIRYRIQGPLDWASEEAVQTVRGLLPGTGAPRRAAEDTAGTISDNRGE